MTESPGTQATDGVPTYQAQHIAAHYRPLSSLLFFSRLLCETLADTPYADAFLAGEA